MLPFGWLVLETLTVFLLVTHPSHSNPVSAPRVFLSFKGKDDLLFSHCTFWVMLNTHVVDGLVG